VFQAIHDGAPDERLLSYQYLQMLPQLAQGEANKIWVIPSEFSNALGNLTDRLAGPPAPPKPPATPAAREEASQAAAADAEEAAAAAREAAAEASSAQTPGATPPSP
jgi:hypothetical protein